MSEVRLPRVAIVDFGMGNLFSVKHACEWAGLQATITASRETLLSADAVILPGVGAFGDAMAALCRHDLVSVLQEIEACGKPFLGICLGMQLLMTESYEFGRHKGLGFIKGEVVRLEHSVEHDRTLKVPQIGWNRIMQSGPGSWQGALLDGVPDGEFMYFVHSFYVKPVDPRVVLSLTRYGSTNICSSLRQGNIFACQFHPERSGPQGLQVYRNLAKQVNEAVRGG